MGHNHDHQTDSMSDRGLVWAIFLNVTLTVVEIVAGILSGSLALVGDAIHNGSDAVSIVIALVARRWSRRPADDRHTYGYRRASIVGAMINVTSLIIIGLYLLYESGIRLLNPEPIDGWIMVGVAAVALVVDIGTVLFMRSMGKGLNIKAALAHNFADALASLAVIIAGVAILLWGIEWLDAILTAIIAAYILFQSFGMLKSATSILMDGTPPDCDVDKVVTSMIAVPGVNGILHLYLRQLDEEFYLAEVHVSVKSRDPQELQLIKQSLRVVLKDQFGIHQSTIEFEWAEVGTPCFDDSFSSTGINE